MAPPSEHLSRPTSPVTRWECPRCGREFGRERQAHVCAPAMSIDEYFAARPPGDRAIFEAVMAALEGATETIVEPVSIGILFKRRSTFAELRPRRTGMRLGFASATRLTDDRITSTQRASRTSHRYWHGALITSPEGVDQKVRGWLARAYEAAGG